MAGAWVRNDRENTDEGRTASMGLDTDVISLASLLGRMYGVPHVDPPIKELSIQYPMFYLHPTL